MPTTVSTTDSAAALHLSRLKWTWLATQTMYPNFFATFASFLMQKWVATGQWPKWWTRVWSEEKDMMPTTTAQTCQMLQTRRAGGKLIATAWINSRRVAWATCLLDNKFVGYSECWDYWTQCKHAMIMEDTDCCAYKYLCLNRLRWDEFDWIGSPQMMQVCALLCFSCCFCSCFFYFYFFLSLSFLLQSQKLSRERRQLPQKISFVLTSSSSSKQNDHNTDISHAIKLTLA